MTGATANFDGIIQASFDDEQLVKALAGLQQLGGDMRPLLKRIGVGLVDTTQRRFVEGEGGFQGSGPDGTPWPQLKQAYLNFKRGPHALVEKGMRGGLMGSITFTVDGPSSVKVGSNKKYAAIHQFGGVIKPKNGKALVFRLGKRLVFAKQVVIPARPYLGFGQADRQAAMEAVAFTLNAAMAGSAARRILGQG